MMTGPVRNKTAVKDYPNIALSLFSATLITGMVEV